MENIVKLNVVEVLKIFERIYSQVIYKDMDFTYILPFMLWGPPGVGKSSIVKELSYIIEKKYNKSVSLLDLRLINYSVIDLKGLPYRSEDKQFTEFLKPKIFDLRDDDNTVNIIFLDELLSAPKAIQAVALQLVLDRSIDQIRLPKNTLIIGASNRIQDHCNISSMTPALANRFAHIEVISDVNHWLKYAVEHNIDERIVAYIQYRPTMLLDENRDEKYAYTSPRIWEKLSIVISGVDDIDELSYLIYSIIGMQAGLEFIQFSKEVSHISKIDEIVNGKGKIPIRNDSKYMVLTYLVYVLKSKQFNDLEMNNIFEYILGYSKDYICCFIYLIKDMFDSLYLNSLPGYKKLNMKVNS